MLGCKRAASSDPRERGGRAFDPIQAAALCVFAALGSTAFATALSPRGYQNGSGVAIALLLGLLVSLLLLLALKALLARLLDPPRGGSTYPLLTGALVLLLAAAGARTLVSRTAGNGMQESGRAQAQQAFHRWTLQAVPLIVRYKDTLAAVGPLVRGPAPRTVDAALAARVDRARQSLLRLEPPIRQLARAAPRELRPFMPLLIQAVTLAAAATRQYAAALSRPGTGSGPRRLGPGSRALLRQGNRLLRRSQQAMIAFTVYVNGVGGQLVNG